MRTPVSSSDRRYRHAFVVGKFAPFHRGHQELVSQAEGLADRVTLMIWSNPDFPDMPNQTRAEWIRALHPSVEVLVADDGPPNHEPGEVHRAHVADTLDRAGLTPDVVVSAESYGDELAGSIGAEHVRLERGADRSDRSGTAIRADVHARRHQLDPLVYRHFVERIAILGAESTGKSTLTAALAEVLDTAHVPEVGRDYYEARGGQLELADYVTIAHLHRSAEDDATPRVNRFLVSDTNALTTMFFSHYYNRDSLPELRSLADDCRLRYRHVIVCDDDIGFEQDGWRDSADWRARMQGMVLHDLAVRGIPYTVVRGSVDERVAQAVAYVTGREPASPTSAVRTIGPRPR